MHYREPNSTAAIPSTCCHSFWWILGCYYDSRSIGLVLLSIISDDLVIVIVRSIRYRPLQFWKERERSGSEGYARASTCWNPSGRDIGTEHTLARAHLCVSGADAGAPPGYIQHKCPPPLYSSVLSRAQHSTRTLWWGINFHSFSFSLHNSRRSLLVLLLAPICDVIQSGS